MTKTSANVQLPRSQRVHTVTPASVSDIYQRALVPSCGTSAGQSVLRTPTSDAVTCPKCLKMAAL